MSSVKRKRFFSSERVVIFGFSFLILIGTFLLMLPISSREKTSFLGALFTATSSSCVTGLVVYDTATHFTFFGKAVILAMIQIGGMGVVTMAVLAVKMAGKRIGLFGRSVMQSSISAPKLEGIVKLTGFIFSTSVVIELLGAFALSFSFCKRFGLLKGICYAIFHSISAFCNAGFDIVPKAEPFSSLCNYTDDPIVNIAIMLLIVIGGIGFMTWDDIKKNKLKFSKYRTQSKVIIFVTSVLIIIPAVFFYSFEFSGFDLKNRIFASLFQSVTLRTAGFNTVSFDGISESGKLIMIFLMLIGGAPGSTAGGMKITTVAVMYASVISVFRKKNHAQVFSRRIPEKTVKDAAAILTLYVMLFIIGGIIISMTEGLSLISCLFETASAVGTVGLTVGITPALSAVSKIILIMLMFLGRVGGLTFVFATVSRSDVDTNNLPLENITVG